MDIEVRVTGEKATAQLLNRLSHRLDDGRTQLGGIVDQLLAAERARFRGQGQRWKPLASSTRKRDARGGRDPRLMINTGTLMRSLTVRGAPGQIVRVTPTTLTFGTRIWYAKFHHRGQGVPKRTLVGLTRAQKAHVVGEVKDLLFKDL